ncbi:hypothetical protein E4634_08320 [Mangrovimicrobium sediminis]|uniref:Histidine kinase/HSP90-like ATPase domain-containing protein n=1 Tax=Mangrovimicrobium sediminis TaxID=2562682 RepID=A0A4Z0M3W4_9GAMM|nr:triple tyrosine motif-containing protein [Haliea sp. SAOS-164]TGD74127.1 hypothetical protein E4634_08320 [Haliea sp. SAOS-164]
MDVLKRTFSFCLFFLLHLSFFSTASTGEEIVSIDESTLNKYLKQKTITSIFSARNSHLWVGTQQGLYEFDGATVRVYHSNNEDEQKIPDSNISGIGETEDGRIYIVCHSGRVAFLDPTSDSFVEVNMRSITSRRGATKLLFSFGNYAFLEISGEAVVVDLQSMKENSSLASKLAIHTSSKIQKIVEVSKGILIAATKSEVVRIDVVEELVDTLNDAPSESNIASVATIDEESFLVLTEESQGHIMFLDSKRRIEKIDFPDIEMQEITDSTYHNGSVWIGTNSGLAKISLSTMSPQFFHAKNSPISHNYITKLYVEDDAFWVGTYKGLDKVIYSNINSFNSRNSGIYDDVLAIDQDIMGRTWIGTYNGLYFVDGASRIHTQFPSEQLPDHRVMTISSFRNKIWIGFEEYGVVLVDCKTLDTSRLLQPDTSSMSVTKILHGGNNTTWIATYNHGIFSTKREGNPSTKGYLKDESIIAVYETSDQTILAASEENIYAKQHNHDEFFKIDIKFEDTNITPTVFSIGEDADSNIVLGTKDFGIVTFPLRSVLAKQVEAKPFSDSSFVNRSTIYGILQDEHRNFWASTQDGVVTIGPKGKLIHHLGKFDGLQDDDFNFGAYYQSATGVLYFGGVNGYSRFHPNDISIRRKVPKIEISGIFSSKSPTTPTRLPVSVDTIGVSKSTSSISIYTNVVDFLYYSKNRYKHRLLGLEETWIDNGTNNIATYNTLPPGEYIFQVIGANAAGVWNNDGASLKIVVHPDWWQTRWAYASYATLLILFLWMALRWYRTYVLKEQALEFAGEMQSQAFRVQNELEEQQDMHDAVIQAIHQQNRATLDLVRSCTVGLSSGYTEPHDMSGELHCFEMLEERYYYQSGHLLANVHEFTEATISNLMPLSPVEPGEITCINSVFNSLLPAHYAAPLAIIIYELLENAFTHAFDAGEIARYIEVRLEHQKEGPEGDLSLVLTVADDGKGLPHSIDPYRAATPGFAIVRRLCDHLNAELLIQSLSGTRVTITIPMTS